MGLLSRPLDISDAARARARLLLETCCAHGVTRFAGVPCSYLAELFTALSQQPGFSYVAAPREDVALAYAAGCQLAGAGAAVALQNSGLGHLVNPLSSLNLVYEIPVLLIIGWRGKRASADAPEHRYMGPVTEAILRDLGVPHYVVGAADVQQQTEAAIRELKRSSRPAALLVPKGVLSGPHS